MVFTTVQGGGAYKSPKSHLIAFVRKHYYIPEGGVKITVLRNTQPFKNNPFMENLG